MTYGMSKVRCWFIVVESLRIGEIQGEEKEGGCVERIVLLGKKAEEVTAQRREDDRRCATEYNRIAYRGGDGVQMRWWGRREESSRIAPG
jgi:hypothetical protein